MTGRIATLFAYSLLLLLLAACGAPVAAAPAAVAAGAPLRATLLAQIDAYARALAPCPGPNTATDPCRGRAMRDTRARFPEFDAYVTWRDAIWYCISDGKGGYTRINTFVYYPPSLGELRDPDRLDVYVSGTPRCGVAGPH